MCLLLSVHPVLRNPRSLQIPRPDKFPQSLFSKKNTVLWSGISLGWLLFNCKYPPPNCKRQPYPTSLNTKARSSDLLALRCPAVFIGGERESWESPSHFLHPCTGRWRKAVIYSLLTSKSNCHIQHNTGINLTFKGSSTICFNILVFQFPPLVYISSPSFQNTLTFKGGAPAYNDVFSKKIVSLIFCLGSEISSEMSFWWSEHLWNSKIFWCQNSVQTMSKQCPNNVRTGLDIVRTSKFPRKLIEFQGCADYQNSFLSLDKFRNEFLMIDTSLRPHFLGNFWCPNSVQTMSKQCLDTVWTLFGHQKCPRKRVSEVCRPSETHCLTNPWSQTKNRGQKNDRFFFFDVVIRRRSSFNACKLIKHGSWPLFWPLLHQQK